MMGPNLGVHRTSILLFLKRIFQYRHLDAFLSCNIETIYEQDLPHPLLIQIHPTRLRDGPRPNAVYWPINTRSTAPSTAWGRSLHASVPSLYCTVACMKIAWSQSPWDYIRSRSYDSFDEIWEIREIKLMASSRSLRMIGWLRALKIWSKNLGISIATR